MELEILNRREFIRLCGKAGLLIAGVGVSGCIQSFGNDNKVISTDTNVDSLTFIVASDTHFDAHTVDRKVDKLLENIKIINPEFVIITGDITTADIDGWELCINKYIKFKNNVSVPIFEFPGNHDAINANLKDWIQIMKKPIYYSFDWRGIHFVALADEYGGTAGVVSDEQLQWFQDDIKNNQDKTIIALSHQPLPYTVYGTERPEDKINLQENSDKLIDILNNTNAVKLWFSGHLHFDHSFKPAIKEIYGTTFISVGAMLDNRNLRTFEIKVVDVRKNDITVKTLDVFRNKFLDNETYVLNM